MLHSYSSCLHSIFRRPRPGPREEKSQTARDRECGPRVRPETSDARDTTESEKKRELPTWKIPKIPKAAEAYYAPDSLHVIAQTADPDALKAEGRREPDS